MTQSEPTTEKTGIDETIDRIERLYRALTGRDLPPGEAAYAPIPAERDPAQHVQERLEQLLGLLGGQAVRTEDAPSWAPPLSAWETEGEIVLCVDLPGVRREDVDVTIQGNALTITGRRVAPVAGEGARLRMSEVPLAPFRRTVVVPGVARGAEPRAQMRDGILEVHLQREAVQATAPMSISVH